MKKPEIFPQTKRKNITFDFDTYNFSSIGRELTEDELYIVNGGKQIENSDEAVANAQIGDTLTRKDGTVITINQGDIDYAKKQIAGSTNSNGSPVSSNTGAASGNDTETSHVNTETAQNNTPVEQTDRDHSGSNSSAGSSQLSSSGTGTGYSTQSSSTFVDDSANNQDSIIKMKKNSSVEIDTKKQTISVNITDKKGLKDANELFGYLSLVGYSFEIKSEDRILRSYSTAKAVNSIVKEIISYKGNISDLVEKLEKNTGYESLTNEKALLQNESNVEKFLYKIMQNPEDYSMTVYQRKAVFPGKRNNKMTHSFCLIKQYSTNEVYTLSFNGTKKAIYSEGAWGLNTETDVVSYDSYKYGKNRYDMSILFGCDRINVEETAENILDSIASATTYYLFDHTHDKPNVENCNTALYNTIAFDSIRNYEGS